MNFDIKSLQFEFYSENCINECEINGERIIYNGCSENTLEESLNFYDKYNWVYIGSGHKTWHNGRENNWKKLHHFFVYKDRIKEIRHIKLKKLNASTL